MSETIFKLQPDRNWVPTSPHNRAGSAISRLKEKCLDIFGAIRQNCNSNEKQLMATESGPFGHHASLKDALQFIGVTARTVMKQGFELLESSNKRPDQVLAVVERTFLGGGSLSNGLDEGDLSGDEWKALVSSAALVVMAIAIKGESAQSVESELRRAELMDTPGSGYTSFVSLVREQQARLRGTWERAQLVSQVLPALVRVETTVDLRFGFRADQVEYCAPILLVHLDTDAYGQEVWFQLTRPQLEGFIQDLQSSLARMKSAETVGSRILAE